MTADANARRHHEGRALTHWQVLGVALPIVLANASTPLLGVVDTTIMGQLGPAFLIGAVALGAVIFDFVFWAFGFLRMGTTGLTAQADGANDPAEVRASLERALLIAAGIGGALLLLQWPIRDAAFWLMSPTPDVEAAGRLYFDIRIWCAPMTLANYALLGWFLGLGRSALGLGLQLLLNISNIGFNVFFVVGLGMTVDGVALGTVLAETLTCLVGLGVAAWFLAGRDARFSLSRVLDRVAIWRTMALNGDIMIRTLCLIFGFSFFTAQGAQQGEIILAANAVLMHFYIVTGYMMDGFAFAAERFVGRAVGRRDPAALREAVWMTSVWALILSAIGTGICFVLGGTFIDAMAVNPEVRSMAREFLFYAALSPLIGAACVQLDGIFIGATRSADMRNMMIASLLIYMLAWWLLTPAFGNHGLWMALLVFLGARGVTLGLRLPSLMRHAATPQAI